MRKVFDTLASVPAARLSSHTNQGTRSVWRAERGKWREAVMTLFTYAHIPGFSHSSEGSCGPLAQAAISVATTSSQIGFFRAGALPLVLSAAP